MHEIVSQALRPADIAVVRRIEGFERIRAGYPAYLSDESKLSCQRFDHLFFPRSEAELSAVLREMDRRGIKVTIAGARTGLVGGCVPSEGALVSLENFDRTLALYHDMPCGEWRLAAQPAASLRAIEAQLATRHILPETINAVIAERKKRHPGLHKLGTDLAVPDERLRDMWAVYRDGLRDAGLEWAAFGHTGNNHLHVNILPRDMADLEKALGLYQSFAEKAVAFGGTVSAEHGIGKLKAKFLKTMFSAEEINEMRAVKRALEPQLMLNPGNIFEG